MLDANQAWLKLKKSIANVEVETIYELEDLYVFSLRSIGSKPGACTGTVGVTVHKETGKIEGIMGDDPRLYKGSTLKLLDPELFK